MQSTLLTEWAGARSWVDSEDVGRYTWLMTGSRLFKWVTVLALIWHAVMIGVYAWNNAQKVRNGRDFASYYYAAEVASEGGNPYDKAALAKKSRQDRVRKPHPYFYPPAFLSVVSWTGWFSLQTSFQLWFWLGELAALATLMALWRWLRPLGPGIWAIAVIAFSLCTAVPNNHLMGQANFLMMALVLVSLYSESRGRSWISGLLLGCAILMKMSPALFVIVWLVERRWRAALTAVVTFLVINGVAAWVWGPETSRIFYTEVLPGFSSGQYNGLAVPIQMFGNHSLPNLWHQLWPHGSSGLSDLARGASFVTALGLVGLTLWPMRRPAATELGAAARWSAVAMVMLLIPVYTYEHHLIWALPAVVVTGFACCQGRLTRVWIAPLGLAWLGWGISLKRVKEIAESLMLDDVWTAPFGWFLQEWKTGACMLLWFALMVLVYRDRPLEWEEAVDG